ncbi:MAG: energy transducer TonB [Pseudomonadota bacterium]
MIRILIAALFLLTCSTVSVGAEPAYLEAYKASNAAYEQGDLTAAINLAETAWREAEKEIGADNKTSILAYNFASMVLYVDPKRAIEPLQRALAIAGPYSEQFAAEPAELMLAYASAVQEDATRKQKSEFLKFLTTFDKENTASASELLAKAWFRAAAIYQVRKRFFAAEKAAKRSVELFDEFVPNDIRSRASVRIIAVAAMVSAPMLRKSRSKEALALLNEAIDFFGPQPRLETYDSVLGLAIAWKSAIATKANLVGVSDAALSELGVRVPRKGQTRNPGKDISSTDNICTVNWISAEPPEYPVGMLRQGVFGSVFIGYRLSDDGKVKDKRVLGEAPYGTPFADAALEAMDKWRAEPKQYPSEVCEPYHTVSFKYQFSR